MISYAEALAIVLESAWLLESEEVPLRQAAGRTLAEDVFSDIAMPPFHRSAMDGFACRRADLGRPLRIVETIPAGKWPVRRIGPGECAKIMTGAPLPEGADCVFMIERSELLQEDTARFTGQDTADNFAPAGYDIRVGERALSADLRLGPPHLSILAAVGCVNPRVRRKPRVGIFTTGDELTPAGRKPGPAQIRSSNSYQLAALAEGAGGAAIDYGIARDTEADHIRLLRQALAENDVVLSTGGVSVGDYDLVPGVVDQEGLEIRIRKVAIQPGKPMVFAMGPGKACFGLSGNPVSSFVQFELFVRPFLLAMQGAPTQPLEVELPLAETVRRSDTRRMAWLPVTIRGGREAAPTPYHGSGHVNAFAHADGLIHIPVGAEALEARQRVIVRLITAP